MKGILIVIACAVAGYVIVSLLMNTKADDLRPPRGRDDEPPRLPSTDDEPRPAATSLPGSGRSAAARGGDWTLLLDIPRSSSVRDIEAAFRRQRAKAETAGDTAMMERLRQARDAALADKSRG